MTDQKKNESPNEHSVEQRQEKAEIPTPFHEVSQNVSRSDLQQCEQKRSSRWKGTFSGEDGEKLPAIKSGMTLDQAKNASDSINQANRLTIDFGDGRVMTSDGTIVKGGTGRNAPTELSDALLPNSLSQTEQDALNQKFEGWVKEKIDWNAVRREITDNAKPVGVGLSEMLSKSRVLAIGEYHIADNALRDIMPQVIESLKQNGATHLAVEMDSRAQPILNKIYKNHGEITPQMQKELLALADLEASPNFLAILKAATQTEPNLHIVAVDIKDPNRHTLKERNKHMAEVIETVLKDPNAKIVWIGGDEHIARLPEDTNTANAVALLKADNISVATVNGCSIPHFKGHTLTAATPDLTKPIILPTKTLTHVPGLFIDLNATLHPGLKYDAHDAVILFPH